ERERETVKGSTVSFRRLYRIGESSITFVRFPRAARPAPHEHSDSELSNLLLLLLLPPPAAASSSEPPPRIGSERRGEKKNKRRRAKKSTSAAELPSPRAQVSKMSELAATNAAKCSQTTAADSKEKASGAKPQEQEEEEVDIDLEAPETEKAALAIQNQFRRFQKKKK
uniref:Si:dkey-46i9.1 n=1 Tax=Gasterosteus aculeatus aculeatus TaxID=481459 RepID=G3Q547_GASAC